MEMFTAEDLAILSWPGSWEKVDALQRAFFPKLAPLQVEANRLIRIVYGIDVNSQYKVSQTPTRPHRAGQPYTAGERNDNVVSVGLRGLGKPSHLQRPSGKTCQMHFALLAFSVAEVELRPILTVAFEPYILRYAEHHRLDLGHSVASHGLDDVLAELPGGLAVPKDQWTGKVSDLLRHDRAWLLANSVDLEAANQTDLARCVISYVAMFPILDLFTRLSNGEVVYREEAGRLVSANNPDYAARFLEWRGSEGQQYTRGFHVEPLNEKDIWQAEAATRATFEYLLDRAFPKMRPAWLKSARDANLELDGYCEELHLAFEYQGEYHYMDVPVHQRQRSLAEVQKIDKLKAKICEGQGVSLIQVPYWENGNQSWIVEALLGLGRSEIEDILAKR